ncbi:MAG: peptidase C1 [Cytophagales bacterium]|nr:MAG: peptidase C1 [Cytophagales bacterium]
MKTIKHYFPIFLFSFFLFACGGSENSTENSADEQSQNNQQQAAFSQGCNLDKVEFDKAEVFEPLATSLPENKQAGRVSLLEFAPKRKSQGSQGSCTAWASAYAAATILHAAATGGNPDKIAFSPSFVYNQITQGNCTGTHIGATLDKLSEEGVLSLAEFPYTDKSCSTEPNNQQIQKAKNYKLRGYNRLTLKDDDYKIDKEAIKQNISQGAPVVIGMAVGGTFYDITNGSEIWKPTQKDRNAIKKNLDGHIVDDGGGESFGGHAMCVIGFDDSYEGGAFQIMNSWGENWGNKGTFWMRYEDFEYFTNAFYGEAYGMYPLPKKNREFDFECAIGLLENKSSTYFPFKAKGGNVFETTKVIPQNTKFKIAVKNEVECYTYVFGQETNGTSYVLFPYTEKHSPFMGIVGARLFPKDYSLQLDNVGTKDVMAVIFTKEKIDYKALNDKISQSSGSTYQAKIAQALGSTAVENVKFTGGDKIYFSAKSAGKNAVAVVFEMNKK